MDKIMDILLFYNLYRLFYIFGKVLNIITNFRFWAIHIPLICLFVYVLDICMETYFFYEFLQLKTIGSVLLCNCCHQHHIRNEQK